jgi:inositol 3-alpha-galactosyltransferase
MESQGDTPAIARPKRAWVTLLTRPSYLAGAVLLAHSLKTYQSAYPLLILYTPSLPASLLPALAQEARLSNAILQPIESLIPRDKESISLIAARFEDTWTKLQVFSLVEYERLVFLDADMLVFRNMDELFELKLPGSDWIAANHACVCNLDRDEWAPDDWRKENCAYTGLTHPGAMTEPCPVPPPGQGTRTHTLLNSGLFVFEPSEKLWKEMMNFWHTTPRLKEYMFPDQDFLADFFSGRWMSVGWQYNALKTMRYWHPEMWRDEEVRNLHYIVDKPWNKRVGPDGVAGYRGDDGVTHRWWWDEYERWEKARDSAGETDVMTMMRAHVAQPLRAEENVRN